MTLREAAIGQTVRVKKLTGDGPVKRRIMDMGITKGVEINIRKVAPLGFGNASATIATIMGLVAKEEVVGVFGVLDFIGLTKLAGISFMLFNLFCAPCFAALGAIKRDEQCKMVQDNSGLPVCICIPCIICCI